MKQNTKAPGTVFWDFDGTLASRPNMWLSACCDALDESTPTHNVNIDDLKKELSSGFPWHAPELSYIHLKEPEAWWGHISNHFHTILERLGVRSDQGQITSRIRESITDSACYTLFDDVIPALERLAAEGWLQIIVSNHIPELEELIIGLGLSQYFSRILSSARIGYEKPNPEMFNHALRFSIPERPVWMIGDSMHADCLPAVHLGIHAILVRRMSSDFEPKFGNLSDAVDFLVTA